MGGQNSVCIRKEKLNTKLHSQTFSSLSFFNNLSEKLIEMIEQQNKLINKNIKKLVFGFKIQNSISILNEIYFFLDSRLSNFKIGQKEQNKKQVKGFIFKSIFKNKKFLLHRMYKRIVLYFEKEDISQMDQKLAQHLLSAIYFLCKIFKKIVQFFYQPLTRFIKIQNYSQMVDLFYSEICESIFLSQFKPNHYVQYVKEQNPQQSKNYKDVYLSSIMQSQKKQNQIRVIYNKCFEFYLSQVKEQVYINQQRFYQKQQKFASLLNDNNSKNTQYKQLFFYMSKICQSFQLTKKYKYILIIGQKAQEIYLRELKNLHFKKNLSLPLTVTMSPQKIQKMKFEIHNTILNPDQNIELFKYLFINWRNNTALYDKHSLVKHFLIPMKLMDLIHLKQSYIEQDLRTSYYNFQIALRQLLSFQM